VSGAPWQGPPRAEEPRQCSRLLENPADRDEARRIATFSSVGEDYRDGSQGLHSGSIQHEELFFTDNVLNRTIPTTPEMSDAVRMPSFAASRASP
jgi:hypothetical protein